MQKPETRLRAKIKRALEARDCLVTVQHGSSLTGGGRSDLIGCSPRGRFFALEVKMPDGHATKLQAVFLAEVDRRRGIARIVRSVEEAITAMEEEFDLEALFEEVTRPEGAATAVARPAPEKPKRGRPRKAPEPELVPADGYHEAPAYSTQEETILEQIRVLEHRVAVLEQHLLLAPQEDVDL